MPAQRPSASTVHVPVLLREVLEGLALEPGLLVVDGTIGGGGHAAKIRERIQPGGRLIGLDRDPAAIDRLAAAFQGPDVDLVPRGYCDLSAVLLERGLTSVDRILVDLGLSSDQLATADRGFSFQVDGPLDLRFNPQEGVPASTLLATLDTVELARVFTDFGEESAARRIADAIVRERGSAAVDTTSHLAALIERTVGAAKPGDRHPATRVFQALRIAVNRELDHVQEAVTRVFPDSLAAGGLLAVITFHSLEDRIVKMAFRNGAVWEAVHSKPIVATPAEIRFNPRSRSAKLRIARRVP